MLHFAPESLSSEASTPYPEALARLASIRHALRLVDGFGGGPASDPDAEIELEVALEAATPARKRCFDTRTNGTAGAAAAGLEAHLAERAAGRTPNEAASRKRAEEIRLGLEDVSRLMLAGQPYRAPASADLPFPLAL